MVNGGLREAPGGRPPEGSLPIDRLRIEFPGRIDEQQPRTAVRPLDLAVETGMPPGVTGRSRLLDANPDRVLIAVGAHFDHTLDMAGGFALAPQRLARAAKVPGLAGRNGLA